MSTDHSTCILCECCREEPATETDRHVGPVCGSCADRLSTVEVVMRYEFRAGCGDPRKDHES